ncbi:hypothetical protein V8C86DRAFT_2444062 [Haematococcus lacustris]
MACFLLHSICVMRDGGKKPGAERQARRQRRGTLSEGRGLHLSFATRIDSATLEEQAQGGSPMEETPIETSPDGIMEAVRAHSLIIATGATARKLGIPREQTLGSRGISACAISDGASPRIKNKPMAVVGGATRRQRRPCTSPTVLPPCQLPGAPAGARQQAACQLGRCLANPLITVHFNTGVEDAEGNGVLANPQLLDTQTGGEGVGGAGGGGGEAAAGRGQPECGIGHTPNTQLLGTLTELGSKGYVKAITAAGSGCMAALSVEPYLTQHGLAQEFKPSAEQEEGQEGHGRPARDSEALHKLYHESERLIAVLHTSPSCGPCRSLKPSSPQALKPSSPQARGGRLPRPATLRGGEASQGGWPGPLAKVWVKPPHPSVAVTRWTLKPTLRLLRPRAAMAPTLQLVKNKDMLQVVPGVKQKREYRELLKTNL